MLQTIKFFNLFTSLQKDTIFFNICQQFFENIFGFFTVYFFTTNYNSENKITKPKDIMKFHKEIKGFDEKEKPSGKIYKVAEISKFIIRKFENINPLSLMRILYFLSRDRKNEYGYNLFREKIKIISSGPMVEEVYEKYRFWGTSKIFKKEEFEIDKADQDKIIGIVKKYPYNSSTELLELFWKNKTETAY